MRRKLEPVRKLASAVLMFSGLVVGFILVSPVLLYEKIKERMNKDSSL